MQFELNGEVTRVQGPLNLSTLLERFELQKRRVAVAVNEMVVPRSRFELYEIHEGDRIEVIQAVGGG
ncbi:MAG: sulfur carrier protein ThiS [Myxococcales bacterium]|nr:sulfur carrier protein ThiS [Myxococcales bacterium]MCZ6712522.1 sulfur carrier protein ThiS [Deltaproteobacteria bacterium]MCZ6822015.1 sulfur carrier protein ThiS [Deltaproteobacteria bacterium]TDI95151.1 MAG: sulfur carrier protein ThiS [Deltaproteobacteria bacterium]